MSTNQGIVSQDTHPPTLERNINNEFSPRLLAHHAQEWQVSAIARDIISANLQSLSQGEEIFYRLFPNPERKNGGGLTAQWHKRSEACDRSSGWWVSGIDPQTWEDMEWGRFKPDPGSALGWDYQKGKPAKYKSPLGTVSRLTFLRVPLAQWEQISGRYQIPIGAEYLEMPIGIGFWQWVLAHPELPVILTEGEKKAGALLSHGFCAIALPGIWMGRRVDREAGYQESLVRDLELFCNGAREFTFAFDTDLKPSTVRAVNTAIWKTGRLIGKAGCSVKVCTIPLLPDGKGAVDDLIAERGILTFEECLYQAKPLNQWKWKLDVSRPSRPDLLITKSDLNRTYFAKKIPKDTDLVICSPKGTGKSKLIGKLIKKDERVVALSHRISLARELSDRWDLTYRGDIEKVRGLAIGKDGEQALRVATCTESLVRLDSDLTGATLLIDEVDQVLRSMLTSPTNNKNGLRPAILARFEQMVRTAARVIVASADVSDLEINYIQELRPELRPFVILNEYQPPGYRVNHLKSSNPQVIISRMMAAAKAGEKLFISTGSKGKAKTIHKLLLKQNPNLKIMLVTSETSGSKEQIDFIQNINQRVREYDIVIATPSMGTGVSIEIEYFDQVFGLYPGVLTDWEIAQALGRVRANIPRTIWVAPVGKSFSKVSTSEYPNLVRRSLKDIRGASNQATEAMIARTSLRPDLNPLLEHDWNWDNNPHIHLWAQYQAKTNRSMWCLRDHVIARLEHEGNTVIEESPDPDPGGKEEIKQAKAEVEAAEHQAILEAPEISATEAEALERKLNLSPEENAKLQRYKVENFYRGPVTIEILKLDNKGRYRSKLTQIEYLLDGGELALNSDYRKFEQQIQHGQGAFAPDMGLSALRFQVREILNLKAYIQPGIQYDDAALEELGNLCRSYAPAIKLVLGLSIPQDASNCWIFRKLWEQLGVKTQGQRVGKGRRRLVWIDGDGFNQLAEILNRRYFHRVGLGSVEETWNQCGGNSEVGVAGLPIYKNKEETGLLCGCI